MPFEQASTRGDRPSLCALVQGLRLRSTNFSAAATCLASSLVTSRTRTFVSTARMAPLDVLPHTCLQFLKRLGPRGAGKYRPMGFFRREAAGSPNHNLVA